MADEADDAIHFLCEVSNEGPPGPPGPTLMTCDRFPFEASSMMMFSLLSLSECTGRRVR